MTTDSSLPPLLLSEGQKLRRAGSHQSFSGSRTIIALILREIATTYGSTPGGYIWAILEPVIMIALLSFIFSLGFKHPALGTNFAIFYATGVLPYGYFNTLSSRMAASISYSKNLLGYPRVTFMDVLAARLILNMMTQAVVATLIFTGLKLAFETRTTLELPRILLSYAMATAFAVGVGTVNCFLMSMSPLWERVWPLISRPLFYVSGVLFILEMMPDSIHGILLYNPLMHITSEMRAAFYYSYEASFVSPTYVFGVSLVLFALGLLLLRRFHRDIREL